MLGSSHQMNSIGLFRVNSPTSMGGGDPHKSKLDFHFDISSSMSPVYKDLMKLIGNFVLNRD